ncbi:MAG: hypothetical protein V4665_00900 [Patescibacteria group bacterium]
MHYVKKLQSKPEHVRKQILVGILAVSMFLVGSVWVYGLSAHESRPRTQASSESSLKPFALFKNSVSSAYQNISASVGNISFSGDKDISGEKQVDLIVVDHPATE